LSVEGSALRDNIVQSQSSGIDEVRHLIACDLLKRESIDFHLRSIAWGGNSMSSLGPIRWSPVFFIESRINLWFDTADSNKAVTRLLVLFVAVWTGFQVPSYMPSAPYSYIAKVRD